MRDRPLHIICDNISKTCIDKDKILSLLVCNSSNFLFCWFQSLEEIKKTWNELKFVLNQYKKCKGDPCPVLSNMEDSTKILEDNMLNLQSVSGSRNAAPFLTTVRQWEKDLSIISDTMEVCIIDSSIRDHLLKQKTVLEKLMQVQLRRRSGPLLTLRLTGRGFCSSVIAVKHMTWMIDKEFLTASWGYLWVHRLSLTII